MKKRSAVFLVIAAFALVTPGVMLAQGPAGGLSQALGNFIAVLCAADPTFEFAPGDTLPPLNGKLTVEAISDVDTGVDSGDGDAIRALTVTVTHGETSSTHVVLYEDNDGTGSLTCQDTILAVT